SQATTLAQYLHLFLHCGLLLHFALMTGAQFGAERNKLQKQSIDDFPLIPFDSLDGRARARVTALSRRLTAGDETVFSDIDAFFGHLYGLTDTDLQVVFDPLEVGQAYRESSGQRACAPPRMTECATFVHRVRELLAPFIEIEPSQLQVSLWYPSGTSQ